MTNEKDDQGGDERPRRSGEPSPVGEGQLPHAAPRYAVIGRGFSGATDDLAEAETWIANNHSGAVYERIDALNELYDALKELRINANRLCDRNLGGTYEDDCRRSLVVADVALAKAKQ